MTNETIRLLRDDERAIFALRALYDRYGYNRYKMSKFEEYDLYVRNKSFLLSDHIITFTDTTGKLMALKPDVTLSIVKNTKDVSHGVQKLYYDENVYRIAKSGYGFREIMQVGLECIGDVDTYCLSEVLTLAAESLSLVCEDFVLDVSHMGILSAVLDGTGASDEVRDALLQCVGEKNLHGIEAVASAAGLPSDATARLCSLVSTYGRAVEVLPVLRDMLSGDGFAALDELCDVLATLSDAPWYDRIRLDFSVVNDLNYYNGIVFQGFVRDVPAVILSGGQYDRLVEKMGKKSGAVGFAVYPDLLEDTASMQKSFDVDVVLLYDECSDTAALRREMRRMTGEGLRVTAQKCIPEKLTYRQLCKMNESEVVLLEDHA